MEVDGLTRGHRTEGSLTQNDKEEWFRPKGDEVRCFEKLVDVPQTGSQIQDPCVSTFRVRDGNSSRVRPYTSSPHFPTPSTLLVLLYRTRPFTVLSYGTPWSPRIISNSDPRQLPPKNLLHYKLDSEVPSFPQSVTSPPPCPTTPDSLNERPVGGVPTYWTRQCLSGRECSPDTNQITKRQ